MNTPTSGREAYFYLSHARPPSLAVDHWVRTFYEHLFRAVQNLAGHHVELEIGSGDFLPPGPDRDAEIDRAVGAARVFVPLYSPEYVDSPPHDRALFLERLTSAVDGKTGNVQPVLWVPLPPGRTDPELAAALELDRDLEEYVRHGLSAMYRLRIHADRYRAVVQRLAERIVEAAERSVPVAATARQSAEFQSPSQADNSFIIAVIAPDERRMPPGRHTACYGSRSTAWRPFRNNQDLPIADYTAGVARRMMLPTRVVDFAASDNRLETSAGVILIDPWVLAHDAGRPIVRAAFDALRQWVTLVVVVDRTDPQYETGSALAGEVMRIGGDNAGHRVIRDVSQFEQQIGRLILRTRRHYLNRPPASVARQADPAHADGPPGSAPEKDLL